MYQHYKPLRNLVRTLELEHSLTVIWELSHHLVNGGPPPRIRGAPPFTDLRKIIRPYQILLLCREVLLNANGPGRRSLSEWKDLGSVLDAITRYSGLVGNVNPDNVQMMLHRVAQQQLPLQRPISIGRLMRYVHLYLNPEVATLLQRSLDITAREFTFLGIAIRLHHTAPCPAGKGRPGDLSVPVRRTYMHARFCRRRGAVCRLR
jgi:hypothetical protein